MFKAIFLLFFPSAISATVLCVDMGGTRVKSATMPDELIYDDLKNITVQITPSGDWLSERLPLFFASEESQKYDRISFAVKGPVYQQQYYLYKPRKIPFHLADEIERVSGLPCIAETNAITLTYGAFKLLELKEERVDFPALVITLGTGVGIVFAKDKDHLVGYEFYNMPDFVYDEYERVFTELFGKPPLPWKEMGPLGTRMQETYFKDLSESEYVTAYRRLFRALLVDIQNYFSGEVKTVVVGKGHSRYLEPEDVSGYLLSPQFLENESLSSELLSVLGTWALDHDRPPPAAQYPTHEEVYDTTCAR